MYLIRFHVLKDNPVGTNQLLRTLHSFVQIDMLMRTARQC